MRIASFVLSRHQIPFQLPLFHRVCPGSALAGLNTYSNSPFLISHHFTITNTKYFPFGKNIQESEGHTIAWGELHQMGACPSAGQYSAVCPVPPPNLVFAPASRT